MILFAKSMIKFEVNTFVRYGNQYFSLISWGICLKWCLLNRGLLWEFSSWKMKGPRDLLDVLKNSLRTMFVKTRVHYSLYTVHSIFFLLHILSSSAAKWKVVVIAVFLSKSDHCSILYIMRLFWCEDWFQ